MLLGNEASGVQEKVTDQPYLLRGQVTMQKGADVLPVLLAAATAAGQAGGDGVFELDLSGVSSADSVIFAIILELGRHLAQTGRQLKVRALPDSLRGLATVYGIESLLQVYG